MPRLLNLLLIAFFLTACNSPASTRLPPTVQPPTQAPGDQQAAPTPTANQVLEQPAGGSDAQPTASPTPGAEEPTATSAPAALPGAGKEDPALSGAVWEWSSSALANGGTVTASTPFRFALAFLPGGKLDVQADCFHSSGSYQVNAPSLSLQTGAPADPGCIPGSQAGEFLRQVASVSSFSLKDGYLTLALNPSGTIKLVPQVVLPVVPPAEGEAAGVATSNIHVHSGPGLDYPSYGALLAGTKFALAGRHFDSGGWWALKLPGFPDEIGWVGPLYVTASNINDLPYLRLIDLQVGGQLLWPDLSDPLASMDAPTPILAGPGTQYPIVLVGLSSDTFYVIGRSEDSQYLVIYINPSAVPGGIGWIPVSSATTRDIANVPVYKAPPMPAAVRFLQPAPGGAIAGAWTGINLRTGPDVDYPVVTTLLHGEFAPILAQTPDHHWWQVQVPASLSKDRVAWVNQSVVSAINADQVKMVDYPFPPMYGQFEKVGPDCQVVSLNPDYLQEFGKGDDFDAEFVIRNNTDFTWASSDVDWVYIGNIDDAVIHFGPNRIDFTDDVPPGGTVALKFRGEAVRKHKGIFGEMWVVRKAGKTICSFTYEIKVHD